MQSPRPCPITALRQPSPADRLQQGRRYLQHRYRQLFGCSPYARWQPATRGGSPWQPLYSDRELALVLGIHQVEVSSHG